MMAGLPRKRLKVVHNATPWTNLAAELNGDKIHDEKVVMNFCTRHGISVATARARLKLCGPKTTPEVEQNRTIRCGRKRAGT